MSYQTYYTVYRAKTDKVVAFGTAKECAKMMDLASVNSFYSLVSRASNGKNRKWNIVKDELD